MKFEQSFFPPSPNMNIEYFTIEFLWLFEEYKQQFMIEHIRRQNKRVKRKVMHSRAKQLSEIEGGKLKLTISCGFAFNVICELRFHHEAHENYEKTFAHFSMKVSFKKNTLLLTLRLSAYAACKSRKVIAKLLAVLAHATVFAPEKKSQNINSLTLQL